MQHASTLKKLDTTKPAQEQYNRLYGCARRILDHKPWEFMEEPHILAVRGPASGATQFIMVTGALGTHFSVQSYPSFDALNRMSAEGPTEQHTLDRLMGIPHLQLVFGGKADLFPGEAEIIKNSGVAFGRGAGGKWPSAESFFPGYRPGKIGGVEIEVMIEGLGQLLHKLDANESVPEITGPDSPICTRVFKDGAWQEAMLCHEMGPPPSASLPLDRLAVLHKLPINRQEWICGCFTVPMSMEGTRERPCMPRMLIIMDKASEMILLPEFTLPKEGMMWTLDDALDKLVEFMIKKNFRPSKIHFEGWVFEGIEEALCANLRVGLGEDYCPEIYEAFRDMTSRFVDW